jgi:peptidoglycan/LPS O-acetylase OafA/YrhL
MADSNKGRIVFLDYMRVFAFVSVLIGHKFYSYLTDLANDASQHITIRAIAEFFLPLCEGGAAGVVVFFLTSGYIITHVLQKEASTDFLIKRIFRIYPLYVTAIILESLFDHYISAIPFPDTYTFLQRILLIGDFFNTPYALQGVEWTLRIEVIFYFYMFVIKATGAFNQQKLLPLLHMVAAIGIFIIPSFPGPGTWTTGYFNAYVPFLLAGSILYLSQQRLASRVVCTISIIALLFISMSVISEYQPRWKTSHYAGYATIIFITAMLLRQQLLDSKGLRILSDMTYSVYLFHNWAWNYIAIPVKSAGLQGISAQGAITLILLALCYFMHKTVETYGIRLGRPVINGIRRLENLALNRRPSPVITNSLS